MTSAIMTQERSALRMSQHQSAMLYFVEYHFLADCVKAFYCD